MQVCKQQPRKITGGAWRNQAGPGALGTRVAGERAVVLTGGVQRAPAEQAPTDSVGLCSILVTIEAAAAGPPPPATPGRAALGFAGCWGAGRCWGGSERHVRCASRVQLGSFKSFCWPSKSLDGMLNLDRNGTKPATQPDHDADFKAAAACRPAAAPPPGTVQSRWPRACVLYGRADLGRYIQRPVACNLCKSTHATTQYGWKRSSSSSVPCHDIHARRPHTTTHS